VPLPSCPRPSSKTRQRRNPRKGPENHPFVAKRERVAREDCASQPCWEKWKKLAISTLTARTTRNQFAAVKLPKCHLCWRTRCTNYSLQMASSSESEGFFPVPRSSPSTLGAIPFPFLPALYTAFSIFSSSASRPRVSSLSFSPPAIPARASCVTSLSSFSPSSSRSLLCHVLS